MFQSTKRNRMNGMEQLQDRRMMAGDVANPYVAEITVDSSDTISIQGSYFGDSASISHDTNGTDNPLDDKLIVSVRTRRITQTEVVDKYQPNGAPRISKVVFHGGRGNDTLFNYTDVAIEAYGEEGNDYFHASSGSTELHGGPGDDVLVSTDGEAVHDMPRLRCHATHDLDHQTVSEIAERILHRDAERDRELRVGPLGR